MVANEQIDDLPELPSPAVMELSTTLWCEICDAYPHITCNDALAVIANLAGMLVSSVIGADYRRLAADEFRHCVDGVMTQAIERGDREEATVN